MKKMNSKRLFMLVITACFIWNTTALPIFAAHTDGHTDVTARIEAVPDETETVGSGDVIPDSETDKVPDSQPAQTGDNSRPELWIAFLLISGCVGCGAALYGKKKSIL